GAVLVGITFGPTGILEHLFVDRWIGPQWPAHLQPTGEHHLNWLLMLLSSAIALGGIGLAYAAYVRTPTLAESLCRAVGGLYAWSRNRFYLDELFEALFVRPVEALARLLRLLDLYLVDGIIELLAQIPALAGYLMRPFQNGLVQFYALLMALGVGGFLVATILR
ncbi:MAG: NADH-quinone oxidoreductase subunit L, partial [Gemmataceae bacterium]|nr:NADH-quinone oxidoreductase subunit L [Gemmataceae bacterium]